MRLLTRGVYDDSTRHPDTSACDRLMHGTKHTGVTVNLVAIPADESPRRPAVLRGSLKMPVEAEREREDLLSQFVALPVTDCPLLNHQSVVRTSGACERSHPRLLVE